MPQPLKVLIVEDNPTDAELELLELRSAGFDPDWLRVETEAAYLENLHSGLDLVLSDFSMPQFNGLRALELLQQRRLDVPFILVSGTIGEDTAVAAMKLGAADYLMKDRLARLGAAVTHALAERKLRGERERTATALREAEAKYRSLFENSSDGIFQNTPEGRFIAANPALAQILGFASPEELIRERTDIGQQGYAEPALREKFRRSLEERGSIKDFEYEVPRKDGTKIWISENVRIVRDAAGHAIYYEGSVRDVTERKRSEQAQQQLAQQVEIERARLVEAQAVANVGSWETIVSTLKVIWSSETFRIFETDPKVFQPTHQSFLQLVHPDDRAKVDRAFYESLNHPSHCTIEHRLLLPGGRIKFVEERWRAYADEQGKPIRVFGTCHDITERKLADLALQESERRFKALFEHAAVGVAVADATTGRFVQVNQRFADIAGRGREELEQLTFVAITHPQDAGRDAEMMQQIRTGRIRESTREKRYLRKDGSEVWVNLTVSAMWAPGETPGLCIAVVQDITGRKRLDEHFLQAQKMEVLGQFSGGVAHDFNNILAAINGYTELARMVLKDNPAVREYLNSVLVASGRAAALVRQILTFSRQEPIERHLIQLQAVVAECHKLLRATIPATIEIDVSIAADAPTVLANANQVHQVVMNLGINAWHAMRDRPGRLQVKLEPCLVDEALAATQPRLRPGSYARVSVSDTGSGMDAATLGRIFEPFFTTKPPGEGTGLGLSVVHGIMASHDGAVTVYSQPGEGTVFHLYFPAQAGAAAEAAVDAGPMPRGQGERILFVDDEELLARLGQKTLTELGYETEIATDPTAALALVRTDPARFALVLTDQTMPGMTGLHLANEIRQIRPGMPIILMTGFSVSLTPARLEAAGIGQLLLKPSTINSLGTAVHSALSHPTAQSHG